MRGRVYTPEAYAALAARGFLGFEHAGVGGVWVPDRTIRVPEVIAPDSCPRGPFGWLPPPMIAPGLDRRRTPLLGTVTADATDGGYFPQSSAEWTSLNSPSFTAWDSLWLLQEASGNFADSIGSITLTAGTVSYAQAVTGFTFKAFTCAENVTGGGLTSSANLPDLNTTSMLLLIYIQLLATPSTNRDWFETGGSGVSIRGRFNTTPAFQLVDGNTVTGTGTVNVVRRYVMQYNKTGSTCKMWNDVAKVTSTFSAPATGKSLRLGGSSGGGTTPNAAWMYGAMIKGANAEASEADIATLFDSLKHTSATFTRTWTTSFTGALAESESESESLGVVYSVPLALAESVSEAESAASLAAFTVATAESVTESEAAAASMGIAYGVAESVTESEALANGPMQANVAPAETVSVAESLATLQAIVIAFSDSETVSESLAALQAIVAALAESESEAEALANGPMQANVAPAEAVTLAEALAAAMAAAPPLAETVSLSESLAALQAVVAALAESTTLAEALTALMAAAPSLVESATLAEALAAVAHDTVGLTDSGSFAEALGVLRAAVIGLAESESETEAVATHQGITVALSEALASTEALRLIEFFYIATLRALAPYIAAEMKRVLVEEGD